MEFPPRLDEVSTRATPFPRGRHAGSSGTVAAVSASQAPGTTRTVDLGGPVHVVDFGGNPDGPVVVLVHGLGGSHLNWDLLAPRLTGAARVLALDLPGFGRSEPGERPGSV